MRCFQASLGQKSLWTFSKTKYFLSSRLGLKKILDNFYQQGDPCLKINSKFFSRPCMSNNTPIESPSRLKIRNIVFLKTFTVISGRFSPIAPECISTRLWITQNLVEDSFLYILYNLEVKRTIFGEADDEFYRKNPSSTFRVL